MTWLLIHDPDAPAPGFAGTAFGGLPAAPAGQALDWPTCRACQGPMQFLGQLGLPVPDGDAPAAVDELALLFMCQNDPGCCDEWDANAGGNAVRVVLATDLKAQSAPASGETQRDVRHGARLTHTALGYDQARGDFPPRAVLGMVGGEPSWLQGDETPDCDACGQPMRFLAQLEEGPEHASEMNFGGGCAYVHLCRCAETAKAKLLWQC